MRVHANILDTILNSPTDAPRTASAKIGDLFLDADVRSAQHGTDAHYAHRASVDNETGLGEAFSQVGGAELRKQAAVKATRLKTLSAAIKFANALGPKAGVKLAAEEEQRLSAIKAAAARLSRILAKTPEQMTQDGALKVADYFDALLVPGWAKQASADLALIQRIHDELQRVPALKTAAAPHKDISDDEIKRFIRASLNQGIAPRLIEEKLSKMADLQAFDKSMGSQYLNDHAGVLGLAYIEPNHYMNDCESTYKRTDNKIAGVKPRSVLRIKACAGCTHFKEAQSHCSLYRLPIVASQADLMPIINNLTAGSKQKKAALVQIANGGEPRAAKTSSESFSRTGAKGAVLSHANTAKTASAEPFTASSVLGRHNAGESLSRIYEHGVKTAGVVAAKKSVKEFIGGLKGSQTRIALTQIDCAVLKNKLSASNAIQGGPKCSSCSFRSGMHCGMTGGTLVSFPGMATAKKASRVQAGAPSDGMAMVREFDLAETRTASDIEYTNPVRDSVEFGGGGMDL